MKKPNIIFYFSDQQRWDTMGCYGQKLEVTPNLDKLAGEGVRFDNAFTCQPVCGPARACIQTGLYATANGCWRNGIAPLAPDADTIAKYLSAGGYNTAYFGKWHLASGINSNYMTLAVPPELRGGYDYWMAADALEFTSHGYDGFVYDGNCEKVEFKGYRVDCINDFALDYLNNYNDENPFFMFISQLEPHHQNDHDCYEGPDGSKERFKDYEVPEDLKGKEGDWAENYPDYLGCCERLDYNVGKLFDVLKEKGLDENTVFIYTSDHGSHFKTRNSEYKRSCHDGCIHIPMIINGPGFEKGVVDDRLVSLIDIAPTILNCAGITPPENFHGKVLNDPEAEWRDCVFVQISESHIGRCIRTKQWKYSVKAEGSGWRESCADVYYEDYLYDLEADPHELNNLVSDSAYINIRAELAKRLSREMEKAGEKTPAILPVK